MRINTNIAAMNAQRQLGKTQGAIENSLARLSSGFRINKAADDAAGLGIANKLRADVRALSQASKNAEQANSVLQIAEGSVGAIQDILERMKELATQSASDNVDANGRTRIDTEFGDLRAEIGRLVATTKFQGKNLLDNSFGNTVDATSTILAAGSEVYGVKLSGAAADTYTVTNSAAGELTITDSAASRTEVVTLTASGKQSVQFGTFGITLELDANYDNTVATNTFGDVVVTQGAGGGSFMIGSSGDYTTNDMLSLSAIDLRTNTLGLDGLDLTTAANSQTALVAFDSAMSTVAQALGTIGASQNRIGYAQSNLKVSIQNLSAAESVIRDLDMAEEMTKFTRNQILAQAGTSMLAQANTASQGILSLLRG